MVKILQVVERNKAEKLLRFFNFLIDLFVYYLLVVVVLIFLQLLGIDTGISDESTGTDLKFRFFFTVFYGFFMFVLEAVTKGRSIGKFITGTKVVKTDGTPIETLDFLKRNFSRCVPFDQLSFLGGNGWHDSWSDTRVVKIKDYEKALTLQNDLESIGKPENS